jgi:hypothetical protein
MGCTYQPTEAEIQRELQKLKGDGQQVTERDRASAVAAVLYLQLCKELDQRNQRRERDLLRHYRERDAGREPPRPADLLPVADAARRVHVEQQKVHYWIRNRDLRVWGMPKHYRVSLAELTVLAAEGK